MRRIGWLLIGLAALAAVIFAFLPLSWVTTRYVPGLETASVEGSIWKGRIRGARYQGIAIGDVDAGLAFRPLLKGEAQIDFQRLGERLDGRVTLSRGTGRVSDLSGTLTVRTPAVPIVLGLDDVSVITDLAGRCRSVSGTVTASIGPLPVLGELPPLVGQPRCAGEAFLVPMALPEGGAGLDVRLWATGRWQADLAVTNTHPLVAGLLETAGFQRTADGLVLVMEGQAS
jgi:general secretion pathway protein N